MIQETLTHLRQILENFEQQVFSLRDASMQGYQQQMQQELARYADNYEKRSQIIADYSAKETETLYSTQTLSRITSFLNSALTVYQSSAARSCDCPTAFCRVTAVAHSTCRGRKSLAEITANL